jgi:hypothetical protein
LFEATVVEPGHCRCATKLNRWRHAHCSGRLESEGNLPELFVTAPIYLARFRHRQPSACRGAAVSAG